MQATFQSYSICCVCTFLYRMKERRSMNSCLLIQLWIGLLECIISMVSGDQGWSQLVRYVLPKHWLKPTVEEWLLPFSIQITTACSVKLKPTLKHWEQTVECGPCHHVNRCHLELFVRREMLEIMLTERVQAEPTMVRCSMENWSPQAFASLANTPQLLLPSDAALCLDCSQHCLAGLPKVMKIHPRRVLGRGLEWYYEKIYNDSVAYG